MESFKEVFVSMLLSTMPLWLGSLITFSVATQHYKTFSGYFSAFVGSVSDGEMLIYATAAIAPMFYFALATTERPRDFPGRLSHIICGLLIFMVCTALFGVQRSGVKLNPDFVLPASAVLYFFAIVMIYIATTYRNWRDAAETVIRRAETLPQNEETSFVRAARDHRNG